MADLKAADSFTKEHIRDPKEWLPEPGTFESAKAYRKRVLPLFKKVVGLVQPLYTALTDMKRKYQQASDWNRDLEGRISRLQGEIAEQKAAMQMLQDDAQDLRLLKKFLGETTVENTLREAKSWQMEGLWYKRQNKDQWMDR